MKIEHIKSIHLVTEISKMWNHFEFPDDDDWIVAFEVSEEFARGFMTHMRGVADQIFESGMSAEEIEDFESLATFIYEGSTWFLSLDGTTIIRAREYEDQFDKQIPDDWWMDCISVMKQALARI